jgi:Thymidylate synthase complementing protein
MMKTSLVWASPRPERTIAVAMRRCYSTKAIEDIEAELELKGVEYWKFLLTKCLQDKSLDVLEHFTMTLLVEGVNEVEVGKLVLDFPYVHVLRLNESGWLVSINARTLVELWRDPRGNSFAGPIVAELDSKGISPVFSQLAFGERINAN